MRQSGEIEREIQQVVNVDDVRLHGTEHVRDAIGDERRSIRLLERRAYPVVHNLDDGKSVLYPPRDAAMPARGIVLGAENADMVSRCLLACELQRVNLRAGPMARQKVVNRVKDPHSGERQGNLQAGAST